MQTVALELYNRMIAQSLRCHKRERKPDRELETKLELRRRPILPKNNCESQRARLPSTYGFTPDNDDIKHRPSGTEHPSVD